MFMFLSIDKNKTGNIIVICCGWLEITQLPAVVSFVIYYVVMILFNTPLLHVRSIIN
jgi:hypothetical protein